MVLLNNSLPENVQIQFVKKHGKAGALAYLFLPLVLFFITDFFKQYQIHFLGLSMLTIIMVLARLGLCFNWWSDRIKTDHHWLNIYDFILLSQGLLFGATGPFLLARYSITSFQMLFYFLIIAIYSLGSMVSYAVRPRTNILFIILMHLPTSLIALIAKPDEGSFFIALGTIGFLIFNIRQCIKLHQNQVDFQQKQDAIDFRDNRLNGFINSIPALVTWLDFDLRYQDMNDNFLSQFRLERKDIIGKKMTRDNAPNNLVEQLESFISSNEKMLTAELDYLNNPDSLCKTFLTVFTKNHFSNNADNDSISILSIDITDIKTKEKDIDSQKMQLMENEKMVSLGELAGSIAHEVNNPLAIISGKAHVILHKIDTQQIDMQGLRTYVAHIYETAFRIKKIIESLRLLANEGRIGVIEPTCIKDVILPVIEITHSKIANQQIDLKIEHEDPSLKVVCGLIEMGQVLMNLIVNAIHAIEFFEDDKWIRIQTRAVNNKVQILFIDCGNGIPDEIQKKIFTPFFTTKGSVKGTGIGLSLSRRLIQKQGGELFYDPKQKNTTFVIELPLAEKSIQSAS